MKLAKRLIALAMAVMMSVAVASCGGDKETATDVTTTSATASAEETTVAGETTTVAGAQDATTAAGAQDATTAAQQAGSQDTGSDLAALPSISNKTYDAPTDTKRPSASFISSVKGYTLNIKHPWNFDATNKSMTYYKQAANEVKNKYGATINETGVFDDYNKTLQGEISANKFSNQIYEVQSFNFASYIKNNYMKDLRTAQNTAAVTFTESWYDLNTTQMAAIGGSQYGWTSFDVEYIVPTGILYNKKLIKNANLTDPMVLARKGQWTWNKLEEYAQKLNTSSIAGFRIGAKDSSNLYSSLMTSSGTNLVDIQTGKAPKSNVMTQAGKDALAQIETWVNKGVLTYKADEDWTANKKAFADGKAGMVLGSHDTLQSCTTTAMKNNVGMVPFPTKSASTTYKSVQNVQFMSFIPSYYKDDAEAAKILFLRDEQLQQLYRYREQIFTKLYTTYGLDSDAMSMTYMIKYGATDPSGAKYGKYVSAVNMLDPDGSDADGTPALSNIVLPVLAGGSASKSLSSYGDTLQKKYDSFWSSKVFTGNYSYNK